MEGNALRYFFNLGMAGLFVCFLYKKLYFWQTYEPFHTKSEINNSQAEEKTNSVQ